MFLKQGPQTGDEPMSQRLGAHEDNGAVAAKDGKTQADELIGKIDRQIHEGKI